MAQSGTLTSLRVCRAENCATLEIVARKVVPSRVSRFKSGRRRFNLKGDTMKTKILILLTIISAVFISGCVPNVFHDQTLIDEITENALQGINNNNYLQFSRDFSGIMNMEVSEERFNQIKGVLSTTSGNYISKELYDAEKIGEFVTYMYYCDFELEKVRLTITFREGNYTIEGFYLNSENIQTELNITE